MLMETIASVLEQSHRALELAIVDGASTDGSGAAAVRARDEHPDRLITVVSEPDAGISDAMNKGIRLTSAGLIIHLNAGDRFAHPEVLTRVAESQAAWRWDWGVGEAIAVDQAGHHVHAYRPRGGPDILLTKNAIPHQATFLRRSIFERFGGFRTDLHQAMDYEFWCRIGLVGGVRFHSLGFPVALYRTGGRSSDLRSLLPSLWRVRRELGRAGAGNGVGGDMLFVSRAAAFGPYLGLKRLLARLAGGGAHHGSVHLRRCSGHRLPVESSGSHCAPPGQLAPEPDVAEDPAQGTGDGGIAARVDE